MEMQQTLKDNISISGLEPYGGKEVELLLKPAEPNTGIVFKTPRGSIEAKLDYAFPYKKSILLSNEESRAINVELVRVLNVEHLLATLYVYGIDNARVVVQRVPSPSFEFFRKIGLATDIEVIPNFEDRELTLCNKIERAGWKQQDEPRVLYGISGSIGNDKLRFSSAKEAADGLTIEATTKYKIPGLETLKVQITADQYKQELAKSRPMAFNPDFYWVPTSVASFFASIQNYEFGIGHGWSSSTLFLPVGTKQAWRDQELEQGFLDGGEIARHTIVDRLGSIALLPGRLEGVIVKAYLSGHENDLLVLKKYVLQHLREVEIFANSGRRMKF